MSQDINKDIWSVIDSYFKTTDNYLSKNQLDSYNTFINVNIPKTIRQFNPISFLKVEKGDNDYVIDIEFYIGGSISSTGEVLNDGTGIYIGKPAIKERNFNKQSDDEDEFLYKILYPNEARLKSLTYETEILVDIAIKINVNDPAIWTGGTRTKLIEKVPLGRLPVMVQSKICSLSGSKYSTLRALGECEYDQGGYFIFNGLEKVLVAQERQIENKLYINYRRPKVSEKGGTNSEKYKYFAEIRSTPENKVQPARITRMVVMYPRGISVSNTKGVSEDAIRVIIPNIADSQGNQIEIPLFIVFRALGIVSDKDICQLIINDLEASYAEKMLDYLRISILDAGNVYTQSDAIDYLISRLSSDYLRSSSSIKRKRIFVSDTLKNFLFPHVGSNYLNKAHYLGYMANQVLFTLLGLKNQTDRDSYIYKRIDQSGFLISNIFRDLYFRVQKNFSENLNKIFVERDNKENGTFWLNSVINDDGSTELNIHRIVVDMNSRIKKVPSGKGEFIDKVLRRDYMDNGWDYAFNNCWGLKDADNKSCKQEIVQSLQRLSYLGYVSHIRRINTPLSDSAKLVPPHLLHSTTWGIMCPPETPDGKEIGLRKNLSIMAIITSGTNSYPLLRALTNCGLENIIQVDFEKHKFTKVFLNERLVGYTRNPTFMYRKMKLLKRNALINVYTSISWNINESVIKVSTDSGRAIRPIFVLDKNKKINLTSDIVNKINDPKSPVNWRHLVGGTRNSKDELPYDDNDSNYYYIPEIESDLEILEKYAGIIEYTDKEEEDNLLIAITPEDLKNNNYNYTHCEIHPALILGVVSLANPLLEMNQAPRNQFSAGQSKQSLGIYATNYRSRFDNKGQILYYPQKSLVSTKMEKYIHTSDIPNGVNTIVALACYSGYNQDDSIIINKSAVERGLFRTIKYRSYAARDEYEKGNNDSKGKYLSKIMNPITNNAINLKPGSYSKLDENGIIQEGYKVSENDIIVGVCKLTGDKDNLGNDIYEDNSQFIRLNEDGTIDKVYSNIGNDGQKYVKVRVRKEKIPELGDKFCARHGQKGVIGMMLNNNDMPFTKSGITPDLIINPQAFPKRMTVGQFLETVMGKAACELGRIQELAQFADIDIVAMGEILEKYCGYEKYGNEIMYNGLTGEMMATDIFIGPTYYERLTHQVSDKYQSRDEGMKTALTNQPAQGRALGGGLRIGEMERDALLSYGASSFLKESFMERSDKYSFVISDKTGLIAAYNKEKGIYRDLLTEHTEQYVDSDKNVFKRNLESTTSTFSTVETPESLKLLFQELQTMAIAPRIITENQVNKIILQEDLNSVKDKVYLKTINESDLTFINIDNNNPLFYLEKLYEVSRKNLLSVSTNKSSIVDFAMGQARDLYKWSEAGYTNILGFDNNEYLIDGSKLSAKDRLNMLQNNMKNSDINIKSWANTSTFNFIHADVSLPIYSGEAIRESVPKYRTQFQSLINNSIFHTFDVATLFTGIENFIVSKNKIENFFINAKLLLKQKGFLIMNSLDGEKIFNLLKSSNGSPINGKFYNSTIWTIKPSSGLDLTNSELVSSHTDFTSQTINLSIGEENNDINVPIIHPTTLLTLAKKYGFELLNTSQVKLMFPNTYKSTGTYKELFEILFKKNIDRDINKLSTNEYSDILSFADLNRYYIFQTSSEQLIPDHVYSNSLIQRCLNDNYYINEPKYKEFRLPIQVSFDATLLKYRITEMRAMYGNICNRNFSRLSLASGKYKSYDISKLINDVNGKIESITYKEMGHTNFKNSISYLFDYVKIGIYVRIINSQLAIFAPMFNIDYNSDKLWNNNYINDFTMSEKGNINSWTETIQFKLKDSNNISDLLSYLNNRYSVEYNENNINDTAKSIFLDGCRVYFGNNVINQFVQEFVYYRHMFENLCIEKNNYINDCEFIINVLQHPIYNVKNNQLYNPFTNATGNEESVLAIENRLIPVLGMSSKSSFLDISIPTPYQWKYAINSILPPDCSPHNFIFEKSGKLINAISAVFRFDSCSKNSDRHLFLMNINNLRNKLSKTLGIKLLVNDDAEDNKDVNTLFNDTITFNSNLYNIAKDTIENNALYNLYIDGFGSDDYLTRLIFLDGLLLRLKSNNSQSLWYEKLLVPYDFKKPVSENKNADYVLISDLDNDLMSKLEILEDDNSIIKMMCSNMYKKRDIIFSNDFITEYLHYIVNSISNCIGDVKNYVSTNVFEDIVIDPIDKQSIDIRSDNIPFLLGKDGTKKKYIENITDTTITVNMVKTNYNSIEYQNVTVVGPFSGVNKAIIQLEEINSLKNVLVKVPKNKIGKVIGTNGSNLQKLKIEYNLTVYTTVRPNEILTRISELDITPQEVNDYLFIKLIGNEDDVNSGIEFINDTIKFKPRFTKSFAPTIYDFNSDMLSSEEYNFDFDFAFENNKEIDSNEDENMFLFGGGRKCKYNISLTKFAVIVPYYNKCRVADANFKKSFMTYITKLQDRLTKYRDEIQPLIDFNIIIVECDSITELPKVMINRLSIPDDVILSDDKNDIKILKCNKGTAYNTGFYNAMKLKSSWVVFQEPFLLPNDSLLHKYFTIPTKSSINLLSTVYEPFFNSKRLGVYSIRTSDYNKTMGYPNHIWSYDGCDTIFAYRLEKTGISIKTLIDYNKNFIFEDLNPDYHFNEISDFLIDIENSNASLLYFSNLNQVNKDFKAINKYDKVFKVNLKIKPYMLPLSSITSLLDNYKKRNDLVWKDFHLDFMNDICKYYSNIYKNTSLKGNCITIESDEEIFECVNFQMQLLYEEMFQLNIRNNEEFITLLQETKLYVKNKKSCIEIYFK